MAKRKVHVHIPGYFLDCETDFTLCGQSLSKADYVELDGRKSTSLDAEKVTCGACRRHRMFRRVMGEIQLNDPPFKGYGIDSV